ncbi:MULTISPECIES: hypothetical protein [Streptomyces]|uniref:Uncharacterized protein n=2 Tax=Streptomyces TaxID=1883 RepID=A0ABV9J5K1_9ACTN
MANATARDRLFALIASIPGSGTVDWCDPARALLDEIAAASGRAALLHETADALERMRGYPVFVTPEELVAELRRVAAESGCGHPADEHSVYGCADGCGCEWMPKRPVVVEQPDTREARP